jgi:hypothetical protein
VGDILTRTPGTGISPVTPEKIASIWAQASGRPIDAIALGLFQTLVIAAIKEHPLDEMTE